MLRLIWLHDIILHIAIIGRHFREIMQPRPRLQYSCDFCCILVDGGFGVWGVFTPCSETCGKGTKSRTRKCNNPAPKNGGDECNGPVIENVECKIKECPGKKTYDILYNIYTNTTKLSFFFNLIDL